MVHDVAEFRWRLTQAGKRLVVLFSDGGRGSYPVHQIPPVVLESCVRHLESPKKSRYTEEEALLYLFVRAAKAN